MKQAYKTISMKPDTVDLILRMERIIDVYIEQGFVLSVRQLYYQLVARGIIENTERSYKRIASILNDARLCGMIDWSHIEDRNRDIEVRSRWNSGSHILRDSADAFHMDKWDNQHNRVFVIVEKAALAGVLGGVCQEWDVPLLAARGYPSVSIIREMALDHIAGAIDNGQTVLMLHLGDHDPSGIDMTRDLRDRFQMFLGDERMVNFGLDRIALNMEQIDQYAPPPNPAKTTDSRFLSYLKTYGNESWELDALEPQQLVDLVAGQIQQCVNTDRWQTKSDEIESIRDKIIEIANDFEDDDL